ncbi:hypothetical protein [Streptomyces mobaraensis]|uniref:Uncharacterized protein n=1 Tax=Streptomyces mobaraensis TaxID=35621 RepID=A0A5N5W1K6_STRMB|nr:hypothetical protein [Streptomyces mobaraensis]KAB7835759.1 hypothetical protein FRZ00_26430 [Streptomyces mobaraensis]
MTTVPLTASTSGLFAHYEVDIQQPRAVNLINTRRRRTGLVTVSWLTSPETAFADLVMHRNVYPGPARATPPLAPAPVGWPGPPRRHARARYRRPRDPVPMRIRKRTVVVMALCAIPVIPVLAP